MCVIINSKRLLEDEIPVNICQCNKLPDGIWLSNSHVSLLLENIEIPMFSKYYNHINQYGTTAFSEKQDEIKGKKLIAMTIC